MTVEGNKLLVLDGQGVVFDAPIKRFLATFADDQQLSMTDIEARWESGLRERAWRGQIDDANLWNALAGRSVDAAQTRLRLDASYRPGPAAPHLADWSGKSRLCLLSNHRSGWLLPRLDAFGIRSCFENVWVSDATGHVKPESTAFDPVFQYLDAGLQVLFVDDQPHNVRAAEALGIRGLVAAPDQRWLAQVSRWLS